MYFPRCIVYIRCFCYKRMGNFLGFGGLCMYHLRTGYDPHHNFCNRHRFGTTMDIAPRVVCRYHLHKRFCHRGIGYNRCCWCKLPDIGWLFQVWHMPLRCKQFDHRCNLNNRDRRCRHQGRCLWGDRSGASIGVCHRRVCKPGFGFSDWVCLCSPRFFDTHRQNRNRFGILRQ